MLPDFSKTDLIISKIAASSRCALMEHEVYELLGALKIKTPIFRLMRSADDSTDALPGEKVVLKIVNPMIVHKSDVGGVRIVSKSDIKDAFQKMLEEVPRNFADLLTAREEIPEAMMGLSRDELCSRIAELSEGILAIEFIEGEAGFGHELFLGMRLTREFGPIINAGLGGLDTELYAREIQAGRSGATIGVGVSDDAELIEAFKKTVAFETLTGIARGHIKLIEPDKINTLLETFHALIWRYSPLNPDADFWITECEINPFMIRDGEAIPVDGLLRFEPRKEPKPEPPVEKISNLLKPSNIALIGVSAKGMNFGRVILRNLIKGNFSTDRLAIVKEGDDEIDGVKCYPSIANLPAKFDLIVLSVAATQVASTIEEIINHEKAQSIILITGGMGEKEGAESLEKDVDKVIRSSRSRPDRGPVMVGGNSLGIISVPGGYDTMFVPETKLPKDPEHPLGKRVAFLSQSGAFMISRMSKLGGIMPRYAVSTGNQVDLGIADFLEHLKWDEEIKVFGCYVEGFKDGEGLNFAETAKKITRKGRDVVVYKAGRSAEGRKAASGHTAAIAGDWAVAEAVLTRAGCLVARDFGEWAGFLMLSGLLCDRPAGRGRLAAISNAGYETVGMADNIRGQFHSIPLATLDESTLIELEKILEQFKLAGLVNLRNPLDLTPMAIDRAHVEAVKVLAKDPNVDVIIHACVPLSPMMKTLPAGGPDGLGIDDPEGFTELMIKAFNEDINKPLVVVIDSGVLYDAMAMKFIRSGIPVFRSADEAVRIFGRWLSVKVKAV